MDRRQFLTRSAALVAISALPLPQAQAAVQPQLASGLISNMHFRLIEPIRLVLDGPLVFMRCYFENFVPETATLRVSPDDAPWSNDAAFEIKTMGHGWHVFGCASEVGGKFKVGPFLVIGNGAVRAIDAL